MINIGKENDVDKGNHNDNHNDIRNDVDNDNLPYKQDTYMDKYNIQ
jgi:hypothetical protein